MTNKKNKKIKKIKSQATKSTSLYRNISISFVVFTIMLAVAVFLLFYNKSSVIITPAVQEFDLSLDIQVKDGPSQQDINERNVISGQLKELPETVEGQFEVLSTRTESNELVGKVLIKNSARHSQRLVRTTQLQAENGVIVRTNNAVNIPAGGHVEVEVFAKDPESFRDISIGQLTIIKLGKSLQDKIYGIINSTLTDSPRLIRVLSESDINRAQSELTNSLTNKVRQRLNLSENNDLVVEVDNIIASNEVGDEVDRFNLKIEATVKILDFNPSELMTLLNRKVSGLNLDNMKVEPVDLTKASYSIVDDDFDGAVLIKLNYTVKAIISAQHDLLNKKRLAGKDAKELESMLEQNELVEGAQVITSPYWKSSLPSMESKIEVLIK